MVDYSMAYVPPKILRKWSVDNPAGELYQLFVFDDETVSAANGRFAHASGSKACSWSDFAAGVLDDLVLKTVGANVLAEARDFVAGVLLGRSASGR